jgi:transcriptional regulator with XRE-family HTH domain
MSYRRAVFRDTTDKTPDNLRDGFQKITGKNLEHVKDEVDWTNRQMADLLGVGESTFGRYMSGEIKIPSEKIPILHYSLNVDIRRLICNDTKYPMFLDDEEKEFDFYKSVNNIMMDIMNTATYNEMRAKIEYLYHECGDMLSFVMSPKGRKK